MTIGPGRFLLALRACGFLMRGTVALRSCRFLSVRSEEHTSELQSRSDLVCRLLLEKKKKILSFMCLVLLLRVQHYTRSSLFRSGRIPRRLSLDQPTHSVNPVYKTL